MTTTLPTAEQACDLPDDIREPLHSLSADIRYLFGRVAADGTLASMMADSAVSRLSQIEEASYRLNALITAQAAEIERLTKERDIAIGERIARAKVLSRVRNELVNIQDDLEDEGDRVYFGSTNDADNFRDIVSEVEQWEWHDVLRDAQQVDPFETSRKAIARAEAAEAARDAMRDALKTYQTNFCEGFCSDVPAGFTSKEMEGDCSGCAARAALSLDAQVKS